jgi:hypothetical protein
MLDPKTAATAKKHGARDRTPITKLATMDDLIDYRLGESPWDESIRLILPP